MRCPHRSLTGFTLVEVLIAVTILAVLVSLLFGALYTLSRNARAGEIALQIVDSDRLVQSFLRRQLGDAVPVTERNERRERVLFHGSMASVRFVGHLPAHRGGGGLQFLELGHEPADESGVLVLYYRNAWPEARFESSISDGWTREILIPGVERIELNYYGSRDAESAPTWTRTWSDHDRLPAMIRLDLELAGGRSWPGLVIAVRTRTAEGQSHLFHTTGEHAP